MRRQADPIDLVRRANPVADPTALPEGPSALVDRIVAEADRQERRSVFPMRLGVAIAVAAAVVLMMWLGGQGPSLPEDLSAASPPTETVGDPAAAAGPGTTVPFINGALVRLDLPRSHSTVMDSDIAAVVRSDVALGLDVFGLAAGDDNVLVSPYSIGTNLSMLLPGARGETASEIIDVLHLTVDEATLHAVRRSIGQLLEDAVSTPTENDPWPFDLQPINSAWGQGGYPFLDDYLAVLATEYDAGVRVVDFAADPSGAMDTINDWVADATGSRIPDLIPPTAVTEDTRLVLVNAVWFSANWVHQFDPDHTADGTFRLLGGAEVPVPFMHASIRTGYASRDGFEALRLPYAGDAEMVIVLPKEGSPAELAASFEPGDLDIRWQDSQVDVTLPSFEFATNVPLKGILQQLGMQAAFESPGSGPDGGADLTGIVASRELFVWEAVHRTKIGVDEYGTEASAASAVIAGRLSRPTPEVFTADRPFLFWIRHIPTGEVLFLGQLVDPR